MEAARTAGPGPEAAQVPTSHDGDTSDAGADHEGDATAMGAAHGGEGVAKAGGVTADHHMGPEEQDLASTHDG